MLIRAPRAAVDRRRTAWVLTVLATAASTYALEAFAIAVGALLAASGVLAGLDRALLLIVLAGTYVLWAAGLRVSTNVPSKAAHDIARARKAGPRTRRWAASGAYVLTEAAKEMPYYAGAFGATLVSDAVSARDAIVFLAGTNIGAALYEYGLGRATRRCLRHRAPVDAQAGGRDSAAP